MKQFLVLVALLFSSTVYADAVIFSGSDVKTLKPNIDLFGQAKIMAGALDPSSTAINAPLGSLYLNTVTGLTYKKRDAGATTNWTQAVFSSEAFNTLALKYHAAPPSNPLANSVKVYADNSGQLLKLDSAGVATPIGADNGTGVREYVSNGTAEQTLSSAWAVYADAAGVAPVDATGGTPTVAFSRTTLAAERLRQTASFKLAKDAAARQGEGVAVDFEIDPLDASARLPIYISFEHRTTANYADNDLQLFIVNRDTGLVVPVTTGGTLSTTQGLPAAPTGSKFTGVFYPTDGTSTRYRLAWHVVSTNALAWDYVFDTLHVGGVNLVPGAITTPWQDYTNRGAGTVLAGNFITSSAAVSYGTVAENLIQWRRVGDSMEIRWSYRQTAAGSGSQGYGFNLPAECNCLIDTVRSGTANGSVGATGGYAGSFGGAYAGTTVVTGSMWVLSPQQIFAQVIASGSGGVGSVQAFGVTYGFQVAANASFGFRALVPIQGWGVTSNYSTADTVFLNQPLSAVSDVFSGVPANSSYYALTKNSLTLDPGTYDLSGQVDFFLNGGPTSLTQVQAGWYAANGTNTGTPPTALSTVPGINIRGAVLNGQAFGTGNYTYTSLPASSPTITLTQRTTIYLVPYATTGASANLRTTAYLVANRRPDFSVFGVNGVNQLIQSVNSSTIAWPTGAGVFTDFGSVTLPPGEWDLEAQLTTYNSASGSPAQVITVAVLPVAGNSNAGMLQGVNTAAAPTGGGGVGWTTTPTLTRLNVVLQAPTTYYLKGTVTNSNTGLQVLGSRISARRIR